MDRKYQIFISSPQQDLREGREAAVKAVLRLNHIPVAMEMFNAADDSSWKLITRHIDDSDFYIVILAKRYGSLAGDISFTEKEYDYAVSKGVPIFGFILHENASWPGSKEEDDPQLREKLKLFKSKVQEKQVTFWSNMDSLSADILASLATQMPLVSRPGWVRGNQVVSADAVNEITRLSEENARLRDTRADERFFLIDAMADSSQCQAAIFIHERGIELPKFANYEYGWDGAGGGSGSIGGFGHASLEAAGVFRAAGSGRLYSLTEEGHAFAEWLIRKGRRCKYFWTPMGGWGTIPPDRRSVPWLIEAGAKFEEQKATAEDAS